jgi:outer membrane protein TolC
MAVALDSRPELRISDISIENSRITIKALRNSMMPSLNAIGTLRNNGLAGSISPLPLPPTVPGGPSVPRNPASVDPFFLGGYGTDLRQVFARNFPDYIFGAQLNIPIFNRSARADMAGAQLTLRQTELSQQRQVNSVRVEVSNALIGLQQARVGYQAAVKARILAEQTLDAEQKKYALGASTIFLVIQAQRDLAQAQFNEVLAQAVYARSRNELDRSTGQTLKANNIIMDEAVAGTVSANPSPLPPPEKQP